MSFPARTIRLSTARRLAAVTGTLIAGGHVDAAETEWAANYSRRIKATAERPPDVQAGRNEQARIYVEYVEDMLGHLRSINSQAECLRRPWVAYETTAWIRERTLTEPPQGRHQPFWLMLRAHDHVPSIKTISRNLDRARKADGVVQRADVDCGDGIRGKNK